MNKINYINFENIKSFGSGNESFKLKFQNCDANSFNIIVAPNGSGKSSLATALQGVAHGTIKLDSQDLYKSDFEPRVTIKLDGIYNGIYISDKSKSEISKHMDIFVINSSLNARKVNHYASGSVFSTADLAIDGIKLYENLPEKCVLNYKYQIICKLYRLKRNYLINLSNIFLDYNFLESIYNNKNIIKKCFDQKKIKNAFNVYLDGIRTSNINNDSFNRAKTFIMNNVNVIQVINIIKAFIKTDDIDVIITTLIQVINFCGEQLLIDGKIIDKSFKYSKYKYDKKRIDEHINIFNTTGRTIVSKVKNNSLIIDFFSPKMMSNGERDILCFIGNLIKFEINFKKNIGLLVIDEIFDYLDGGNLLAVQYYLSNFIKSCKKNNKLLFPLILTHLDPEVFKTYVFKKQKIHYYISHSRAFDFNSELIKVIKLRSSLQDSDKKKVIEKFCLHYCNKECNLSDYEISLGDITNNFELYKELFQEVTDKYLVSDSNTFDPIKVALAIRIKIEKMIYNEVSPNLRDKLIEEHTTKGKIEFADSYNLEVPEIYYILSPVYNDILHLSNNNDVVKQKMVSCYLYLNNRLIRQMVKLVFQET